MRFVTTEGELRYAPKHRESVSCKGLHFIKKRVSVMKILIRAVDATLVGFGDSRDGGLGK